MTGSWNEQSSQSKHLPGGIEVLGSCFLFCFVFFFQLRRMGKFRTWLCFINPIHTTLRDATPYPLSRQLHFVYLNVFFTWVSCLTLNLGFMSKK